MVIDSYEEIEILRNYATDTYLPLLNKYTQVREVHKNFPNDNGSNHPSDFVGLFKDSLFEYYTQQMYFNLYNYMKELKEIRINNVEIFELIDEEL